MSGTTVIDWKEFDTSKLVFGALKKGKRGQSSVDVQYVENGVSRDIVLQGPSMRIPFGVQLKQAKGKDANETISYACAFQLTGVLEKVTEEQEKDSNGQLLFNDYDGEKTERMIQTRELFSSTGDVNDEIFKFATFLANLDRFIKRNVLKFHNKWFGKSLSKEIIDTLYTPLIKSSKIPDKYAPNFSCGCIFANGTFITGFFDENSKQIVEKDRILGIPAGSFAIPLIRTSGLWFSNNSFGMKFKCEQMMVFPGLNFRGSCIIQKQAILITPNDPNSYDSYMETDGDTQSQPLAISSNFVLPSNTPKKE